MLEGIGKCAPAQPVEQLAACKIQVQSMAALVRQRPLIEIVRQMFMDEGDTLDD